MDEALNNQVIGTVKYNFIKDLKNKYTAFLGVTFRDLLKHLIYWYRKVMTV